MVKNPPACAGDMDSIPSWEDPQEKEMETHSSILAWEIPWIKEPGELQSMGSQRVGHNLVTKQQCVEKKQNHGIQGIELSVASASTGGLRSYHSWKRWGGYNPLCPGTFLESQGNSTGLCF